MEKKREKKSLREDEKTIFQSNFIRSKFIVTSDWH